MFASNKFEEVQKYITEIHYKVWIGPIVVNAAWLKRQPEDVQKAILEGGRLATENNRKMIAEMETELVKALKDKARNPRQAGRRIRLARKSHERMAAVL
mgnify:CR=1 FL=1